MEKVLADALANFYQQLLKPEFDAIKEKLAEHDERFSEIFGHLDAICSRLGKLERGAGSKDEQDEFLKASVESNP